MRIPFVFVAGLALALMGQGCVGTAVSPSEESPVLEGAVIPSEEEPATEEQAEAVPETAPTPAPKPVPKPAPKPSGATVKPKTVTVEIKDGAFSPQIVAITAGDTVVWKNVGTNNHTTRGIRNGPLVWDSGNLAPGQTYSRTFTAVGRFGYSCGIHPNMTGEVIVGEASALGQ